MNGGGKAFTRSRRLVEGGSCRVPLLPSKRPECGWPERHAMARADVEFIDDSTPERGFETPQRKNPAECDAQGSQSRFGSPRLTCRSCARIPEVVPPNRSAASMV